MAVSSTDFIDYIFQFPSQGAFLGDPVLAPYSAKGSQLLIYNPVETLQGQTPSVGNSLVLLPQLANSTVPLPNFWGMVTLRAIDGVSGRLLLEDGASKLLLESGISALALEGTGPIGSDGLITALSTHPNIQIVNDKTSMLAGKASVISTKIDITHINIIINILGVYVRDGLSIVPQAQPLLVSDTTGNILTDGSGNLLTPP